MRLIFWLVLLSSIAIRLGGILRPLLGNFAVYQTAQGMIARFFLENHLSTWLYPQVNVLTNGKPGIVLLYYPVSSLLAAFLKVSFGGSLDVWGRFQAVIFFALTSIYLYLLIKSLINKELALISLVVFVLSPLTIIYGQSFQNEMATVSFTVMFLYHWRSFIQKNGVLNWFIASLSLSMVLITRPNNVFILLPAFFLIFQSVEWKNRIIISTFKFSALILAGFVLPILWYYHCWRVSWEAPNVYSTLFAQLSSRESFASPLVFKIEYYRELFDLLAGVVLTPIGLTFLLVGFTQYFRVKQASNFFIIWFAASALSSLLIPRKLIDHEFYLLHLLLPACFFIASGIRIFFKNAAQWKRPRIIAGCFFVAALIISSRYAIYPAFVTPAEADNVLKIAEMLRTNLPVESRIIVASPNAMSVLYYSNYLGWTFFYQDNRKVPYYWENPDFAGMGKDLMEQRNRLYEKSVTWLEYLRAQGADYFIGTNLQEFQKDSEFSNYIQAHYKKLSSDGADHVLFDVRSQL